MNVAGGDRVFALIFSQHFIQSQTAQPVITSYRHLRGRSQLHPIQHPDRFRLRTSGHVTLQLDFLSLGYLHVAQWTGEDRSRLAYCNAINIG